MSTLLVDNYDSYTYNVFHLLAAVTGEEPIVVHNDMVSWRALSRWDFDAIVLSPGPGHPGRWHDFGVCADILRSAERAVLGICLGHQGLGRALAGVVETAPSGARHGRLSRVRHLGRGLFEGIPQEFSVVRYHSLAVTGSIGPQGRVTAWTDDGVVMGIEHRDRPLWGVQFHPESIATEHGRTVVENFYALARPHRPARAFPTIRSPTAPRVRARRPREAPAAGGDRAAPLRLHVRTLPGATPTEPLFARLFGACDHAFWLDSADAPTRLAQCSYLGTSAGPERCVLEYDVHEGRVTRHDAAGTTVEQASIFDVLDRELAARALAPAAWPAAANGAASPDGAAPPGGVTTTNGAPPAGAPRGLLAGFVGYLGYECKADCGSPNAHRSDVPDAVQMLATRVVAVDHVHEVTHLLALGRPGEEEVGWWLAEAEAGVRAVRAAASAGATANGATQSQRDHERTDPKPGAPAAGASADVDGDTDDVDPTAAGGGDPVRFRCGRGREQYLADIARCQAELAAGESYEVCLTDQLSTTAAPPPWELYRTLRRANPAPFAAYLRLGEVTVLSSSPERFLSVDRARCVQARPIKGTAARSADPAVDRARHDELLHDEKTFAEHLMIVDLLRNDLGRVCALDTVRVPELMVVESYPTVHQLLSTITGTLEAGRTSVECVRACFPGGSMTGAPKLRTMSIIDDIERVARGVYSGAIGYFGLDGVVDLSIVIRTIVMRPGATTIGAGGAIVMQSDPAEEFDELLLKARAPMAAVARAATGRAGPDAVALELEPAGATAVTA